MPRQLRITYERDTGRFRVSYAASRSTPLKAGPSGKLASARSATGNPACSVAASNWRRKQASPADFKQLAQCRAHAATLKAAHLHRLAGNEAHAQHIEKIASGELLTKEARKTRADRLKESLKSSRKDRSERKRAVPLASHGMPMSLGKSGGIGGDATKGKDHEAILETTRSLTGLEGDGPRSGYMVRDEVFPGARAYAKNQTVVAYGKDLAEDYEAASKKPPSEWDDKDARAVSAVIHEYIHTLGAYGHYSGEDNEFLEEASTELLARHALDQILDDGKAGPDFRDDMKHSGAYNGEVVALRALAEGVGLDPVEAARVLKNLSNDRRENYPRFIQIGKWLGATGDDYHIRDIGAAFNRYVGGSAQLDRLIGGYDRLGEHSVESYKRQVEAFRTLASEITPEVAKALKETLDATIDWSLPRETLTRIREELRDARKEAKGEAHGEWAKTHQEKARAKLAVARKLKVLSNPAVLKAFYVK